MTAKEFNLIRKLQVIAVIDPQAVVNDLKSAAPLGLDKTEVYDWAVQAREVAGTLVELLDLDAEAGE